MINNKQMFQYQQLMIELDEFDKVFKTNRLQLEWIGRIYKYLVKLRSVYDTKNTKRDQWCLTYFREYQALSKLINKCINSKFSDAALELYFGKPLSKTRQLVVLVPNKYTPITIQELIDQQLPIKPTMTDKDLLLDQFLATLSSKQVELFLKLQKYL